MDKFYCILLGFAHSFFSLLYLPLALANYTPYKWHPLHDRGNYWLLSHTYTGKHRWSYSTHCMVSWHYILHWYCLYSLSSCINSRNCSCICSEPHIANCTSWNKFCALLYELCVLAGWIEDWDLGSYLGTAHLAYRAGWSAYNSLACYFLDLANGQGIQQQHIAKKHHPNVTLREEHN